MGGVRRASVFASMRSIVSPCSATTAVKRWNMPPSSARVDFIALSSSSRCCRERGVQKCCCWSASGVLMPSCCQPDMPGSGEPPNPEAPKS